MNSRFMRMTSRLLIASVLSLGLPFQPVHARIVGTDMVGTNKVASSAQSQSAQPQSERERIRTFLDRADVHQQLQAQGIDANTAKARVDALTDEEVLKIAGKLDQMPAGGEILGILLTVFIVLLVTDILGFTKVFPFTRAVR